MIRLGSSVPWDENDRTLLPAPNTREEAGYRQYEPAHNCGRFAWVSLLALFVMFYEAGLILRGQEPVLTKPVKRLTRTELCSWTVLQDSALEDAWIAVSFKTSSNHQEAIA